MVAIARSIIRQRMGTFDPSTYRDRYQEALRGLIETKLKGLPIKPREVITPPPGDRSDGGPETQSRTGNACNRRHEGQAAKASQLRSRSSAAVIASTRSRRSKRKEEPATEPAAIAPRRRKKA